MSTVPEVVIQRLPLYIRTLTRLQDRGVEVISSQELGAAQRMTPAQIRKDLSYFGRFGKQGRGYTVKYLLLELSRILGLDRQWNAAVIGVGRLGRAILGYPGFAPAGFKMIAAFDADPRQVGTRVGELMVQDMAELENVLSKNEIDIAIVSVPADHAQAVADKVVRGGVKAILNYTPFFLQVPSDVRVRSIDPVVALQSMTYYLRQGKTKAG